MVFSQGLPQPFLLHTVIDLLMTRHVGASAHRVPAVSTNERSLQQIKVVACSNVLLVLPSRLALVLGDLKEVCIDDGRDLDRQTSSLLIHVFYLYSRGLQS